MKEDRYYYIIKMILLMLIYIYVPLPPKNGKTNFLSLYIGF